MRALYVGVGFRERRRRFAEADVFGPRLGDWRAGINFDGDLLELFRESSNGSRGIEATRAAGVGSLGSLARKNTVARRAVAAWTSRWAACSVP